jgi:hypothetical protein
MADQNLFEALSRAVATETTAARVLSLNSTDNFKALNIKQQKDLLKTALDGIMAPVSFFTTANEIIIENQVVKKDLFVIDRPLILLNLRKLSVGNELKVTVKEETVTLSISDLINAANNVNIDIKSFSKDISHGNITISTKIPTLNEDTKINVQLKKLFDKIKDEDKLKEIIGELFVVELLKFIKCIKFNNEGSSCVIEFSELSLEQKIKAFETLPMSLNYEFVKFVTEIRNIENSIFNTVVNGEKVTIPQDSSFFFKE